MGLSCSWKKTTFPVWPLTPLVSECIKEKGCSFEQKQRDEDQLIPVVEQQPETQTFSQDDLWQREADKRRHDEELMMNWFACSARHHKASERTNYQTITLALI